MVTALSAYNRHLWLPLFLLAAFLYMMAAFAEAREWELFIVGLLFILFLVFAVCIQPLRTVFFEDEIRILYVIGARDAIPISRITSVYEQGSWVSGGLPVYVICYQHTARKPFL